MDHSDTQAHTSIPTREGPGIATRSIVASHNQVHHILRVVRCIQIILGPKTIPMKSITHIGTHTDMARETASIDGHIGPQVDTFANMILGGDPYDALVFGQDLLDGMTDT